jgi:hypothetical protein
MPIEGKLASIRLATFENLSGILIVSISYSVFKIDIFLSTKVCPDILSSAVEVQSLSSLSIDCR